MKFDDKVGYLLPFLTNDLNEWLIGVHFEKVSADQGRTISSSVL